MYLHGANRHQYCFHSLYVLFVTTHNHTTDVPITLRLVADTNSARIFAATVTGKCRIPTLSRPRLINRPGIPENHGDASAQNPDYASPNNSSLLTHYNR